jgi:hypothetical protein
LCVDEQLRFDSIQRLIALPRSGAHPHHRSTRRPAPHRRYRVREPKTRGARASQRARAAAAAAEARRTAGGHGVLVVDGA